MDKLEQEVTMQEQIIVGFSKKEMEHIDLLVRTGMRRYVAATLVYLSVIPETTSREIERCADLRQPEVSQALKYLIGRDWVTRRVAVSKNKGRPMNIFSLVVPFREIVNTIEKEKRKEVSDKLVIIQKLRESLGNIPG
ncbi:MarR family transcriptional regulator [Methanoregula sp.]|uniref:MarR family transcriptional regulator n=1 Tax=Methanoregula sp. TaxID=2052170 RepID=UPI00356667C2